MRYEYESENEVEEGVELAKKVLLYAVTYNQNAKVGEIREAISILFGEAVDRQLQEQFAPKSAPKQS